MFLKSLLQLLCFVVVVQRIVTDETVSKEDAATEEITTDCVGAAGFRIKKVLQSANSTGFYFLVLVFLV